MVSRIGDAAEAAEAAATGDAGIPRGSVSPRDIPAGPVPRQQRESPPPQRSGPGSPPEGEPSLDDLIDGYGYGYFHFLLFCFLAVAGLSPAKEMVTLSFLGPALSCEFGTSGYEWLLQFVVFFGSLVSAPFYGFLADRWGRKPAIVVACFLVAVPSLLTSLASSYWVVVGLRFVVGLGLPFDPVLFTYYLEFLPDQHRGRQIVALTITWMMALVLEAGIAWLTLNQYSWQVYALASAVPSAAAALMSFFLMESPYFLLDQGKLRSTIQVVRRVAQLSGKPPPPEMELQDVVVGETTLEEEADPVSCFQASLIMPLGSVIPLVGSLCTPRRIWKTMCMIVFTASLGFATIGLVELTVLLHSDSMPSGQGIMLCGPRGALSLNRKEWEQVLIANLSGVWGVLLACTVIDFLGRRTSLMTMFFLASVFTSLMLLPVDVTVKNVFLTIARTAVHGGYPILAVFVGELYSNSLRGSGESLAETTTSLSYMFGPLVTDKIVYFAGGPMQATQVITAVLWAGVLALLLSPSRVSTDELQEDEAASPEPQQPPPSKNE